MVAGTRRSLTTNEAEKSALTNVSFSPVTQTTQGFQTRPGEAHDIDPLTDTPLIGNGYAVSHTENAQTQQRQTSPTTPQRQAINNNLVNRNNTTYGVLVGTDTIALTSIQGHSSSTIGLGDTQHAQGEHTLNTEGLRRKKHKTGSKQKRSKTQPKTLGGAWPQL